MLAILAKHSVNNPKRWLTVENNCIFRQIFSILPTYNQHTLQIYNTQTHLPIFETLNHPPACLLIDRLQLQLACVLSTAASVPDTGPIIALSQNTHAYTLILTHSQRTYTHTGCVWALIQASERSWFISAISRRPKSTTNNNQHHHHPVQILSELSITAY